MFHRSSVVYVGTVLPAAAGPGRGFGELLPARFKLGRPEAGLGVWYHAKHVPVIVHGQACGYGTQLCVCVWVGQDPWLRFGGEELVCHNRSHELIPFSHLKLTGLHRTRNRACDRTCGRPSSGWNGGPNDQIDRRHAREHTRTRSLTRNHTPTHPLRGETVS